MDHPFSRSLKVLVVSLGGLLILALGLLGYRLGTLGKAQLETPRSQQKEIFWLLPQEHVRVVGQWDHYLVLEVFKWAPSGQEPRKPQGKTQEEAKSPGPWATKPGAGLSNTFQKRIVVLNLATGKAQQEIEFRLKPFQGKPKKLKGASLSGPGGR